MGIFSSLGGMVSGGKSMLGRAGKGAAVGGAYGYMSGGDYGSAMGGAAGGALFGAAMPMAGRMMSNKFGSISGLAQKGLGAIGAGATGLGRMGLGLASRGMAKKGTLGGGIMSNLGVGMTKAGITGGAGMSAAAGFMGRNAVSVNKYGGMGLAALGLGASAHIGSSMIGSNRGY